MVKIDRRLDVRDTVCPGPLIEVKRALGALPLGGVLEVLATDPGFLPDMEAFARHTGHLLLGVEQVPAGSRVVLRRTR